MKDGQTVPAGRKVCIVRGCHVHEDEEDFVGDLCAPCHEFVATGRGIHSQSYRNARELAPRVAIMHSRSTARDSRSRGSMPGASTVTRPDRPPYSTSPWPERG